MRNILSRTSCEALLAHISNIDILLLTLGECEERLKSQCQHSLSETLAGIKIRILIPAKV